MTNTRRLRAIKKSALIILVALSLDGCLSGDNPESADDATIEIDLSGSVGDGPLVGSTLSILRSDGEPLARVESDADANYQVTVKSESKFYPFKIEVSGGIDLVTNQAPDFSLVGAVFDSNGRGVANVNPFSTFSVMLAGEMSGGLSADNLETAQAIVANELNSGLTSLVATGPITTEIDETNVSEIVKSSEALVEIMRRTRTLRETAGFPAFGDQVLRSIASDIVDRKIDGRGGSNSDRRTAAVASIVSAQVLLESMVNELHINGVDATAAMRAAVDQISPQSVTETIDDLPVTAEMIDSVVLGLSAAFAVSADPKISEIQAAVSRLQPGMDPASARALLPPNYRDALNNVSTVVAGGDNATIDLVNDVVRAGTDLPGSNQAPTISGTPPSSVTAGNAYAFQPVAEDFDNDLLTFTVTNLPAWATFDAGSGRLSGTPGDSDAGTYTDIRITVSDGTTTASIGPFSIQVVGNTGVQSSVTLSWVAPTENEDGSSLTDLAGYKVYWGTSPGNYTQSVTINNASVSTYVIDNISPGTYEFVATSFNLAGVESAFSSPASKTVQ